MPTYSAIAGSELAVNKPLTSSLMTRLSDNPLAIFEQLGWAVTANVFISAEQTIVAASTFTVNHGLTSFSPTNGIVQAFMICKVAEQGYGVGDVVPINISGDVAGGNSGTSIILSATQITGRIGQGGTNITNATTGVAAIATVASWRLVISVRG